MRAALQHYSRFFVLSIKALLFIFSHLTNKLFHGRNVLDFKIMTKAVSLSLPTLKTIFLS